MAVRTSDEAKLLLLIVSIGVTSVEELVPSVLVLVSLEVLYEQELVVQILSDTVGIVCPRARRAGRILLMRDGNYV